MIKWFSTTAIFRWIAVILLAGIGITSCTSAKKLSYFKNLPDSLLVHLPPSVPEERIIAKGDDLDILLSAEDQEALRPFIRQTGNAPGNSAATGASSTISTPYSYRVDPDGIIELPVLGKLQVAGSTARQLKTRLTDSLEHYLKNPLVEVRFSSLRITVLGEVRGPGNYSLPMQNATLFEALAAAGDLPHSARRYNVHLFRDYNGQRTVAKIDLRNKDVLNNPELFHIRPNDVIYVQARPRALFTEDFSLFASMFTLIVGIVTLAFTISRR